MYFKMVLKSQKLLATSVVTGFFLTEPDGVVAKMALVRELVFVTCGRPFVIV